MTVPSDLRVFFSPEKSEDSERAPRIPRASQEHATERELGPLVQYQGVVRPHPESPLVIGMANRLERVEAAVEHLCNTLPPGRRVLAYEDLSVEERLSLSEWKRHFEQELRQWLAPFWDSTEAVKKETIQELARSTIAGEGATRGYSQVDSASEERLTTLLLLSLRNRRAALSRNAGSKRRKLDH